MKNENQPKVSVIMPVYNAAEFLPQCLDSVAGQTLADIEIICVDDGSSDNSVEILQRYADNDSRFIILTQPNKGAGAARNYGMAVAKGKYLSFLDSDDFFEADMLETAYNRAEKHSAQITVFESEKYFTKSGKFAPNYSIRYHLLPKSDVFGGMDIKKDIFRAFTGWAWDKLFNAEFIKETGLQFQEQRTTNDMFFVFRAVVKAEKITFVPKVLAYYRRDTDSLSVTREKSWHCFYDRLTALKNQLQQWGIYEKLEQDYINYRLHFSLWNLRTLKEPTQTQLYMKLKDEWFKALGITDKGEKYFYNKKEYLTYKKINACLPGKKLKPADNIKLKLRTIADYIYTLLYVLRFHGVGYAVKIIISKLTHR